MDRAEFLPPDTEHAARFDQDTAEIEFWFSAPSTEESS
jgi:hypothetical protein